MNCQQPLDIFIFNLAQKIASIYPNNCADEEDYIQIGHLKLAEINRNKYSQRDSIAYAITAISRAMRQSALEAMYPASAPYRTKRLIHNIELLLDDGKTEQEICHKLKINIKTLANLKSLINSESWHRLFNEPTHNPEPFSVINDILSLHCLTDNDRLFLQAQLDSDTDNLGLTRKQRWLRAKSLRPRLKRSGYGI